MPIEPERIVRRDFPSSPDGYDRAAVDAHLEAIAAALTGESRADAAPAEQVMAAGRQLLGEISALRVELKNTSAGLRERGAAISDALEALLDLGADDAPLAPEATAESVPVPPSAAAAARSPHRLEAADAADAAADARLVALDMALGGSSRAEIERELARFELPDPAALLDEVLSAIG